MGLYTQDEINVLQKNDPRMLQVFLNAINGELRRRTNDNVKWTVADTRWLIESVNDINIEDTAITKILSLSDSLITKITEEVINNPRIVEDEKIEPGEIEWADILLADANITNPALGENVELPVVDENSEYEKGFPPTAEDRIVSDPNA